METTSERDLISPFCLTPESHSEMISLITGFIDFPLFEGTSYKDVLELLLETSSYHDASIVWDSNQPLIDVDGYYIQGLEDYFSAYSGYYTEP